MSELIKLTATEMAKNIKSGEVKPRALLDAHINQIMSVNPRINALVENSFDQAYSEVNKIEKNWSSINKDDYPLLGVPFTIKEFFHVAGLKTTYGLKQFKNNVASENSSVYLRTQKAGGVLLGKTNIPEMGFWWECENPIYGATTNPFSVAHTSGGSTGGEAALIASYGSPVGIGSDVGGSIRLPASFCGIYGHKASHKIIPITGHYPLNQANATEFVGKKYPNTALGPLARSTKDLRLMMSILSGPDGFDQLSQLKFENKKVSFKNKKVYVLSHPKIHAVTETHPQIEKAVLKAADYFKSQGAEIIELKEDFFKSAFMIWMAGMLSIEGPSFQDILKGERSDLSFLRELLKYPLKKSEFTLPSLFTAMLEYAPPSKTDQNQNLEKLAQMRNQLEALLENDSILLMPVSSQTAPTLGGSLLRPFDFVMSGIFCVTGHPATSIPCDFIDGLPYGIQMVSAIGKDHVCLSAAEELEENKIFKKLV